MGYDDVGTCPLRDGLESMGLGMTYITLEFLQPDLDLLNVVANTTNHGLNEADIGTH